jgi:hypothetical protein
MAAGGRPNQFCSRPPNEAATGLSIVVPPESLNVTKFWEQKMSRAHERFQISGLRGPESKKIELCAVDNF